VFDLDPGEGVKMKQLCEVAQEVRDLMGDIGLTTYPLTSGSKGLHLYAPLEEPVSSQGAVVLAKRVAQQLEKAMPKLVTATMTKSVRTGKVFLDWSQNNASKTTIAPYSLRGREHPTVAAPRTWDEIADPKLRHLRFDEVLERVEKLGDLLEPLDDVVPTADRLTKYRSMRDSSKTPEPVPAKAPQTGNNDRFVIQEHHARRLHYDLRLERDGVLVSWAVPKNLPDTPSVNHLAVHTEDHPLEYLTFHGTIPAGEYGGGKMIVWDTGTYETEKFNDIPPDGPAHGGEVIVTLHGEKVDGRYALIQTDGKNWLAHRMKEQKSPRTGDLAPMLSTEGSVANLKASQWAFEGKWDGYRLLVDADHGALCLQSRRGRDVTREYPQLQALAADLADHHVVLDGEVVALDESGVPSFSEPCAIHPSRVLGVRHPATRRPLAAAREIPRPPATAGDAGRGGRPHRARSVGRRRSGGDGARPQESVGRRDRQEVGIHLSAGAAVVVVDQGQDLEHAGSGDRRMARGHRWSHQRHRRADARHTRRRRPALRRTRRHRVHRKGACEAQEHPQATAHRRITFQHKASQCGCQGRDVRQARAGRRGALQRADKRRPAASTQLAWSAAGQGARRCEMGRLAS
jgi:DNA ligase D-like protein (predicted 3'-phosphoesterase)